MAVNDRIPVTPSAAATRANSLLIACDQLRQVYSQFVTIRERMRHMFADAGGSGSINWGTVEALFGLTPGGTSVGPTAVGAAVFTMVDGFVGSVEGTFQTNAGLDLTTRVG